jgi:hypothetical protein
MIFYNPIILFLCAELQFEWKTIEFLNPVEILKFLYFFLNRSLIFSKLLQNGYHPIFTGFRVPKGRTQFQITEKRNTEKQRVIWDRCKKKNTNLDYTSFWRSRQFSGIKN